MTLSAPGVTISLRAVWAYILASSIGDNASSAEKRARNAGLSAALWEARMGRLVEGTQRLQKDAGHYFERVAKYVPSEIIAGYLCMDGITQASVVSAPMTARIVAWIVFGFCLLMTPLYLLAATKPRPGQRRRRPKGQNTQLALASGAFVIWVYAIGGPFKLTPGLHVPVIGSVLLIMFTMAAGLYAPPYERPPADAVNA